MIFLRYDAPFHQSSSADQPNHHPKMARAPGAKNYCRPLLMELVNEFLPNGQTLWKAVAAEYQKRSGESEERDPREMEKYWRFKMCNNYKKPTGGGDAFLLWCLGPQCWGGHLGMRNYVP
jgi:hypothetical protein